MAEQLRVVGEVVNPKAVEWDKRVSEVIRDFVQMGKLLIDGRDNQYYRDLGHDIFEDYCKSKMGLSWSHACQTIRDYMVFDVITSNLGSGIPEPKIQSHITAIGAMASIKTEKRKVQKQDGSDTYVEQPVGVRNQKALADQWSKTVKEFDRRKAKAEKEGKKPPTFSGKFVRNMLPNQYKVSPDRGFNCNPLVRLHNRLEKLHDDMDQQGFDKSAKLEKLVLTEPPALPAQIDWLKDSTDNAISILRIMRQLLEEYEYVEVEE